VALNLADEVARAVHDLASPLTVLRGLCASLQGHATRPEERDLARRVDQEAARVARRVEWLASIATGADSARGRDATLDLRALASELAARHAHVGRPIGVRVVVELPDGPLRIRGDRDRIERAVDNLLSNAVRHAGPRGTVTVSLGRWGAEAVIRVRDDGPGVPPGERDGVFLPGVRGSGAAGPGRGLGLAIAREVAVQHGGSLALESTWSGASFRLGLPLEPPGTSGGCAA
jgi:signal transduction histidine kinase